ncbi:hypothetical protein [Streptomyces sp. NPDC052225]|uniref:hypothetical protein n=1 Tax=Streptomyces sp. NPDC052225 TaxID=3154949 RepID=UPI00343CFDEA
MNLQVRHESGTVVARSEHGVARGKSLAQVERSRLTAYKDQDVYTEQGSGNDWQRWYEVYKNGHWHLQHKATGQCLQAADRGLGIVIRYCDWFAQNQMWD